MRSLATATLTALLHALIPISTVSAWEYTHAGQVATAVLLDPYGDVISGGSLTTTEDEMVVVKHSSADGSEGWRYSFPSEPANRRQVSLAQDAGGAIFAASRYEQGRDGPYVGSIAKLNPEDGVELWRVDLADVGVYAISLDPAGDLVAVGGVRGADPTAENLLVMKFAGDTGAELWRYEVNGAADDIDRALAVEVSSDGDILVGGQIFDNLPLGYPDFFVLKVLGSSGSEIWRTTIPSNAAHGGAARSIAIQPDGDVVAAGQAVLVDWCDFVVARFSGSDGTELWRAVVDEPSIGSCDRAWSVAVDSASDVVVTGAPRTTIFATMKFSGTTGSLLWRHDIPNLGAPSGGECCRGAAVRTDADDNVLVGGAIIGVGDDGEIAVAKLAAGDGTELWRRIVDHDGCGDGAVSLDVNLGGDVVIGGTVFSRIAGECAWPQGGLYAVIKLRGESGEDFTILPELAQCQDDLGDALANLAVCEVDLDQCLSDPPIPDADLDGVSDMRDDCTGTSEGEEVDQGGCSLDQFCGSVDGATKEGRRLCKRLDWKNDEPFMRGRDRDCEIERNGSGREDDRCVAVSG